MRSPKVAVGKMDSLWQLKWRSQADLVSLEGVWLHIGSPGGRIWIGPFALSGNIPVPNQLHPAGEVKKSKRLFGRGVSELVTIGAAAS